MSKSMCVTPRWVITDWYAACRLDSVVHAIASSVPPAPPKETIGVAPSALAVASSWSIVGSLVTGSVSPQIGEQPELITNAAVYDLSPACAAEFSIGSWLFDRSTYGATLPTEPPPTVPVPVGVGLAVAVGELLAVGVPVDVVLGLPVEVVPAVSEKSSA